MYQPDYWRLGIMGQRYFRHRTRQPPRLILLLFQDSFVILFFGHFNFLHFQDFLAGGQAYFYLSRVPRPSFAWAGIFVGSLTYLDRREYSQLFPPPRSPL